MKTFHASRIILLGAILTLGALVQVHAAEDSLVKLISEMADKPENHQSIAAYYKTQAEEARATAALHTQMKVSYHDHSSVKFPGFAAASAEHCDRLIELNLATAEEYEALAELHEGEATQ